MSQDNEQTGQISDAAFELRGMDELLEVLQGPGRRQRQEAAHELAILARQDPSQLMAHTDALIDAIERPEAQTRWEVLTALTELCAINPDAVAQAFDGAEGSLFDEGSATVRLAAFLFLTRLAASSPDRSDAAWPMLDEAIQCYHGDAEYRDMLAGMLEMVQGNISKETQDALVDRVSFDAENGVNYIKAFSAQIVAEAEKRDRA